MRPPGAKRGAAPFGGAESHELRSWARLRRAGCAHALCLPPTLSLPAAFAPSPPALTQTPALTKPLSPTPPQTQPPKNHKTPGLRPPRRARCAGAKRGAAPFGSAESHELRSWARLRRAGCAPALAFPQCFPLPLLSLPLLPPATSPNAPNPKDSPAAFHRLRGSVHLWYFVPALMAQARYSCSHSSTRAS